MKPATPTRASTHFNRPDSHERSRLQPQTLGGTAKDKNARRDTRSGAHLSGWTRTSRGSDVAAIRFVPTARREPSLISPCSTCSGHVDSVLVPDMFAR